MNQHQEIRAEPGEHSTIESWLIEKIAQTVRIPREQVRTQDSFDYYGIDSVEAVEISAALEEYLGRDIPSTIVYDYPTIATLAAHLNS